MWKLFFEVLGKMRGEFIEKRLSMPMRQNLAMIFFTLAAIILILVVLASIYPETWRL